MIENDINVCKQISSLFHGQKADAVILVLLKRNVILSVWLRASNERYFSLKTNNKM